MSDGRKRLGEILVNLGALDDAQLERALALHHDTGKKLGRILVDEKVINEETLVRALSRQYRLQAIQLDQTHIAQDAIRAVPREMALRHHIMPVDLMETSRESYLFVAIEDLTDKDALEAVQRATGMKVLPVLAGSQQVRRAIERHYPATPQPDASEAVAAEVPEPPSPPADTPPPPAVPVDVEAFADALGMNLEPEPNTPPPRRRTGDGAAGASDVVVATPVVAAPPASAGRDVDAALGELAIDERLDPLDAPKVIKPGHMVTALLRILMRKGLITEAEFIEELQRK